MNQIQHSQPGAGSTPPPQPPQPTAPSHTDDVWGVHRPPVLGPPPVGANPPPQDSPFAGQGSTGGPGARSAAGGTSFDRGFATLRRSPLHRDSDRGIIGGVCAGIAQSTGLSVVAVRAAAILLALFFGTGVGAYLIAWAALPDQRGTTHAEQAMRGGRPRSLVVLALGGIALLSALSWIFDSAVLPLVAAAAVVAYVVTKRKGHPSSPHHG